MSATFTWVVESMNSYPQYQGETDVVFQVFWRCIGAEAYSGGIAEAFVYNPCDIALTSGGPFTPYADLTQDQVLSWVWANGVDKDVVEAAVQEAVNKVINPTVVQLPNPWDNKA